MQYAITRDVSESIQRCELTHLSREPVSLDMAREQHAAYCAQLAELGCRVIELPALDEYPDAVFVEDTAIVFDELAVLTRPGAESRRGEVASIERALEPFRTLYRIDGPGTLDGGDVIVAGKQVWVGRSSRSNEEGISQLAQWVQPHGYHVTPIEVSECLHLKSAATSVARDVILLDPRWISPTVFQGCRTIAIDPGEPGAANALPIGSDLIVRAEFPETRNRLISEGFSCRSVAASELAKAEGALTCCSLVFAEDAKG